jgi:peptidoglycan/xylan/chitin deacetylase (PgdA/CDA1 family)
MSKMIFRDDDIAVGTKMPEFEMVHDIFEKYGVKHTIAVICRDIDKNKELVDYINSHELIIPQFHCLDHLPYTDKHDLVRDQFREGVKIFEDAFGVKPTVFYPPWNLVDPWLVNVAIEFGMRADHEKISLHQYIRAGGGVAEDTVNFHYWHHRDKFLLEPALRIHNGLKPKE